MVRGDKDALPARKPTATGGNAEEGRNTVVIAEAIHATIDWTEPRDLCAAEVSCRVDDPAEPGISSEHRGGAWALLRNWDIEFLSNETRLEKGPFGLRVAVHGPSGNRDWSNRR
jgi:hypothetical protein